MTNYPNLEHLLLPLMQSIPVLWLQKQNQKMLVVSVIFIAKGARVMRTANLWQEVGLCNGAAGTVYDFIYQDGHAPPDLPVAVLVQFDNYSGPPFFNNCAPIVPITHEWVSGRQHLSRQQLPLQPRYAITIHKSQGQTLSKAVIDLGKAELAAGCSFVAISRVRKLQDVLFQPMTYDRLLAIGRAMRLIERKEEGARLHSLALQTMS